MLLNLNNRTIRTIKITISLTVLHDSPIYITLRNYTASDSVFELANQTTVQVVKLVYFPMDKVPEYCDLFTTIFALIHGQLFCLILYQ